MVVTLVATTTACIMVITGTTITITWVTCTVVGMVDMEGIITGIMEAITQDTVVMDHMVVMEVIMLDTMADIPMMMSPNDSTCSS